MSEDERFQVKYEVVNGRHQVTFYERGEKKVRYFLDEMAAKKFAAGAAKRKSTGGKRPF